MERKLIEYLPPYLHEYKNLQYIMNTEQVEFETAWKACEDVFDDQYVSTATENGIQRWERILKISPKDTDTLEERKFRVLTRLNEQLPYTYTVLLQRLSALCGKDGFHVLLDNNNYSLYVKVALRNEKIREEISLMLQRIIPANLEYEVILFNTHKILSQFTHEQLSQRTNNELRKEVL